MTLVTRDATTGLRRGPIRYPDGRPPVPSGCRWCGTQQYHHGSSYSNAVGLHRWEQPTDAQILARMRARRDAWKATCRCVPPEEQRPLAPVVDPWKCEAAECAMYDRLLNAWMTPVSPRRAAALMGGAA